MREEQWPRSLRYIGMFYSVDDNAEDPAEHDDNSHSIRIDRQENSHSQSECERFHLEPLDRHVD